MRHQMQMNLSSEIGAGLKLLFSMFPILGRIWLGRTNNWLVMIKVVTPHLWYSLHLPMSCFLGFWYGDTLIVTNTSSKACSEWWCHLDWNKSCHFPFWHTIVCTNMTSLCRQNVIKSSTFDKKINKIGQNVSTYYIFSTQTAEITL